MTCNTWESRLILILIYGWKRKEAFFKSVVACHIPNVYTSALV